MVTASLEEDEAGQNGNPGKDWHDDTRRKPVHGLRCVDDPVDKQHQADDRDDESADIEAPRLWISSLGHHPPDGGQPGGPSRVLQEHASQYRSEGHRSTDRPTPHADRLAPLVGREDNGDDRQGGRHDCCPANAHHDAHRDEHPRTAGEGAGRGGQPEDG